MLIVASDIDSSTERIVQYLSSRGIGINFVTFEHFVSESKDKLLSRVFMIEQEEVTIRTNTRSRRRRITTEQLIEIATENGILELFQHFDNVAMELFDIKGNTTTSRSFLIRTDSGRQTVMSLHPSDRSSKDGLLYRLYTKKLADHLDLTTDAILSVLPPSSAKWEGYWESLEDYSGQEGYFSNVKQIDAFFTELRRLSN